MNPRIRRLQADEAQIRDAFTDHAFVVLDEAAGRPAERYFFTFRVAGMSPAPDGKCEPGGPYRAEVYLPVDYPRRPPFCRMLTPVFHPNIDPQKICIGDHWSAGESLAHLVARIGEMICFQSYNVKSPLNAVAAAWAEKNGERFPLQRDDLTAGL